MKRATLYATVGRQRKPVYSGNPAEANHASYVEGAKVAAILESRASGAQIPVFEYVVASLPKPEPQVAEVASDQPTPTIGAVTETTMKEKA